MAKLRTRLERIERRRGVAASVNPLVIYLCSARCEGAAEGEAYRKGGAIISVRERAIFTGLRNSFELTRSEAEPVEAFVQRVEAAVAEARDR